MFSCLYNDDDTTDVTSASPSTAVATKEEGLFDAAQEAPINRTAEFTCTGLPRPVLLQEQSAIGCGGKLWPAAVMLTEYFAREYANDPSILDGKHVVELGAGTGLVGLALALISPTVTVTITDLDILLPLMKANIELNGLKGRVHAAVLGWGESINEDEVFNWRNLSSSAESSSSKVDIVIAADCVYLESCFDILLTTMHHLTTASPVCRIFVCSKKRRRADRQFFIKLRKQFAVCQPPIDEHLELWRRDGLSLHIATSSAASNKNNALNALE